MDVQDWMLVLAGGLGAGVAVIHGVLIEKYLNAPIHAGSVKLNPVQQRLLGAVTHFSTFNWFLSGCALIAAAYWLDGTTRAPIVALVALAYAYAAAGNLWCTRTAHPGWILYALCLVLMGLSYYPI